METSLHQSLKKRYAGSEAAIEVTVGAYRIDAVCGKKLIEIQFASLAAIRDKIRTLCETSKVHVVKPIVAIRTIVRQEDANGPVISRRKSPKRGTTIDLFDELVYWTRVFPHPNLTLEVPLVSVEEWRLPPDLNGRRRRRYKPKYKVKDVVLQDILETQTFKKSSDLLRLLDMGRLATTFDTSELARHLQKPRWQAQKIAYVLRHIGAICESGKRGNTVIYTVPKPSRRRQAA